jgi:hypothetical protein
MTNPLKRLSSRRRISVSIWLVSVVLCLLLLAFVLR